MNKIYVIGIGYRPLDKKARDVVLGSDVVLANSRLLDIFKGYDEYKSVNDRILTLNSVYETMEFIRAKIKDNYSGTQNSKFRMHNSLLITLLASGDPLFFGIGRMVINEFGKDIVQILPDLSSVQVAFSKIKEPWSEALLISLHGGPDPLKRRRLTYEITDIPRLLERYNKIAILTDKQNNPVEIAKTINSSCTAHCASLKIFVCEKLGYLDEKITEGTPEDISQLSFEYPNVVIIVQSKKPNVNVKNDMSEGYIQVYTGSGKGKTTAALGIALRAAGVGLKVFIAQFIKKGKYSEHKALERFKDLITVKQYGTGFLKNNLPTKPEIEAAGKGLEDVKEIITSKLYDVVILDEINIAAHHNLFSIEELLNVMDLKPPHMELIFTGRYADERVIERADLVTEMKEIKHYIKKGVKARRGIEH